jgi:hypothetical protein
VSGKALGWAAEQKTGSVLAKSVLLRLADMADERWSCFPGVKLLVEETEGSERGVRNALRLLEDLALITTHERRRDNGSATSNRYFLNAPDAPHMRLYGSLDPDVERVTETPKARPVTRPPGSQCPTPRQSVPHPPAVSAPPGGQSVPPQNHPDEPPSEPAREDVREDVRRVLDSLGDSWTVGRMEAFELEPAIVCALDELGWSVERLAAELAKNPGGVKFPSRVIKRRLANLRAVPGVQRRQEQRATAPKCPDHPSAAPRPDGECSGCWVDREGWNDTARTAP